jgi:hypothetical protein
MMMASAPATAQDPAPAAPQAPVHDMEHMDMPMDMDMDMSPGRWMLMQDGSAYLMLNRQGGPRGGTGATAPNWWMGMADRSVSRGALRLTGMFSLDPATVGTDGYREIFQVGEALDGKPLIDRQHPHDFWMQLSASWRSSIGSHTGVTFTGALAGEPALGPVAFMHRASTLAIPFAPLGHHTFDSTHVSFGVATVGVDRGPFTLEASAFNGREPDQRRWNIDLGRMDSVSARLWYRPAPAWELQLSSGHLVSPEQLGHGNVVRTTASASYTHGDPAHMLAATVGVGMNSTDEATRHAGFGEVTRGWGGTLVSVRAELVQVESVLLLTGEVPHSSADEARRDAVGALTAGVQRDLRRWRGFTMAVGANGTLYRVPQMLKATHGAHPGSFQLFLQLRPRTGGMSRMLNMRMGAPPMTP